MLTDHPSPFLVTARRHHAAVCLQGIRWYVSIGRPEKAEDYLWKLCRMGYANVPLVLRWWQRKVKTQTLACSCGERVLQSVLN